MVSYPWNGCMSAGKVGVAANNAAVGGGCAVRFPQRYFVFKKMFKLKLSSHILFGKFDKALLWIPSKLSILHGNETMLSRLCRVQNFQQIQLISIIHLSLMNRWEGGMSNSGPCPLNKVFTDIDGINGMCQCRDRNQLLFKGDDRCHRIYAKVLTYAKLSYLHNKCCHVRI